MKIFMIMLASAIMSFAHNGKASQGDIPLQDGCPPQNGKPIPR